MTDEELAEIRERVAKATPGPWDIVNGITGGLAIVTTLDEGGHKQFYRVVATDSTRYDKNDPIFIAHAREDIPTLLAEVERQRREIETFHSALNDVLAFFVQDRGYDFNCVDAGLKALALHLELPATVALAQKIHELDYDKDKAP